jgi:hypothetical protein
MENIKKINEKEVGSFEKDRGENSSTGHIKSTSQ